MAEGISHSEVPRAVHRARVLQKFVMRESQSSWERRGQKENAEETEVVTSAASAFN